MDRQTIYSGQLPRVNDLLQAQQNIMVALAEMAQSTFGISTLVTSFDVTPTTPASLNVLLTPGCIYQLENLEATQWSALPANTATSVLKQGIQFINGSAAYGVGQPVTIGITPPGTVGYSQVFLIEVQYQDMDGGSKILPYYNAANPNDSYSGPGNAGTAQNTVRYGGVAYQAKAGVAAPTGTQVAPTPDAGWTGLYYVTVANGASTITSGNITEYKDAPFLATNGYLPQIPTGVQNSTWAYAADTGAVNALVASVSPAPAALTPGLRVLVKVANTNTGPATLNLNGLGAVAIHRANGAALSSGDINAGMVADLIYDGSSFQVANFEGFTSSTTNNNTYTTTVPYATDSGSLNALSVTGVGTPNWSSYAAGDTLEVKVAYTNSGPATININGIGIVSIVNNSGNPLLAAQLVAGCIALLVYNGTTFQLLNPSALTLQANATWYVNASTGSDSYDGTSATVSGGHGPFATIQHAINVAATYDMNGYNQTINVANGSYASFQGGPCNGSGTIYIIGNTATPADVTVPWFAAVGTGANYQVEGFRVSNNTGFGDGVASNNGAVLAINAIQFGPCPRAHMSTFDAGSLWFVSGGYIVIEAGANAANHILSQDVGNIQTPNAPGDVYPDLYINGAVTFSNAFVRATGLGSAGAVYNSISGYGNVFGTKYIADTNGIVSSLGGGINYYPGTSAGYTTTGGQYS